MAAEIRLQKFLSSAGIASRRKAETFIVEGRVTVDGEVVTELGTKVDPDRAIVHFDGERVELPARPYYLMMNKPKGTVCTESDPEGRQRVHDLLPKGLPRLFTVGRLDYDTEGLLLFTTDGELASRLMRPGSGVPRIYEVKVQGDVDPNVERRWTEGVRLADGHLCKPAPTELVRRTRTNAWYEVVLSEGKNRQIHRMAEACGKRVLKLKRVAYGPIKLGRLPLGASRELSQEETRDLLAAVNLVRKREPGRPKSRSAAPRPERPPGKPAARREPPRRGEPKRRGAAKPAGRSERKPADKKPTPPRRTSKPQRTDKRRR